MARRILFGLFTLVLAIVGSLLAWAWRPEVTAIEPPSVSSFDTALLAKGAALTSAGNCVDCHTASGGPALAGGRGVPTPFGTIYSTNITPHPESGIGRWSEAAFRRAMRDGISRDGHHLYPAFPYDHFTRLSDDDIRAIYAYVMTRDPVAASVPPNALPFPLNHRLVLAGWKLMFLQRGAYKPDAKQSAEWNRGAYLAQGLAHCGACHTPRNLFGAEKRGDRYGGGFTEGWHGPALNAAAPAPVPWTAERLFNYLRAGFDPAHGVAAGPMAPVVRNLSPLPDGDIRAIATYFASYAARDGGAAAAEPVLQFARQQSYRAVDLAVDGAASDAELGRVLFAGACASCHHNGGNLPFARPVDLALSTAVTAPVPHNLIQVILQGVRLPLREGDPLMPPFDGALTDAQIAAVARFMRGQFSNLPAWTDIEAAIRDIRQGNAPS